MDKMEKTNTRGDLENDSATVSGCASACLSALARAKTRTWALSSAILIGLLSSSVLAHDKHYAVNKQQHDWFMTLRSDTGGPCCSDADGNVIQDADWESLDGHYRVRIEGNWIDVPDGAVVKSPNLYGPTMVWPLTASPYGGPVRIQIRCFMPGSMM